MTMILSFIKKISLIILVGLSIHVYADNSYFHEDFGNSPFYNYIKNENKRVFLIKSEKENVSSLYRNPQFKDNFFSALYSDGAFVIYINKDRLSEECVLTFQFHDVKLCESEKLMSFVKKFVNDEKNQFYKYEKEFDYFLFYHEFSHLLINEKWGYKYHSEVEFLADLMALDMLWMFHNIDYREKVSLLRKNNFYFKSDLQYKYYMKYKGYNLKEMDSDFNIENWFSDIISFKKSSELSHGEKMLMLKEIKSTNNMIIEKIKEYSTEHKIQDLREYKRFFSMKLLTDESFKNQL